MCTVTAHGVCTGVDRAEAVFLFSKRGGEPTVLDADNRIIVQAMAVSNFCPERQVTTLTPPVAVPHDWVLFNVIAQELLTAIQHSSCLSDILQGAFSEDAGTSFIPRDG